jgi:hypothetical protein
MGPLYRKINSAPVRSSYRFFYKLLPIFSIEKCITRLLLSIIISYLQNCYSMETGSGSTLTPEEAARLGDEAAVAAAASDAAAAAAASDSIRMKLLAEKNSGNISLPASSGIVQTATPPIPPSERSKLIRINRELQNKPIVLGGGGLSNLSA